MQFVYNLYIRFNMVLFIFLIPALQGCHGRNSGQPTSAPPKPLVMFYHYVFDSVDASKTDLHATLSNVGLSKDRFGNEGQGHTFDGKSSTATAGLSKSVPSGDFAITFWQRSSSLQRMQALALTGPSGDAISIQVNNQDGVHVETWTDAGVTTLSAGIAGEYTDGQWHHFALQGQGYIVQVYVDGVLLASVVGNGVLRPIQTILIGGSGSKYWEGNLDDVRVHDRSFSADYIPHMVYEWNMIKPSNRADSVAGYYPFNGNAVNDTGKGIDGVLHNGVSPTSDRWGHLNSAYSFDGANSYIELNDSFDPITTDYAIGLWVKTGSYRDMVAISVSPGGVTLDLLLSLQSGIQVLINGVVMISTGDYSLLANNQWHFILLQRQKGVLQLYMDSNLSGTAPSQVSLFGPNSVVRFGKGSGVGQVTYASTWQGELDDVQIYDRSFTPTEIKNLEFMQVRPRDGAGLISYKGKMWLLGGWNVDNFLPTNHEIWSSVDGFNWEFVTNAPWEGRHMAGWVVFADKMWVVGGDNNSGHYQNDVWSSSDGIHWELATQDVPWRDRATHYCLAFGNKLWVMGGQKLFLPPGQMVAYNDVWSSPDGANWQMEALHAPWSERGLILGSVVFKGQMWVIGGGTYDVRSYLNDVWRSQDGVHWDQVIDHAPWSGRQYHSIIVFDNKIWVIAGGVEGNSGGTNEVWYSSDGASWTQFSETPWDIRHATGTCVMNNSLWITCGSSVVLYNDIWKLSYAQ